MSETAYLYVRETSKPKGQRATRCPTDLNFPLVSRKGENGKELRKKDASVGVRFAAVYQTSQSAVFYTPCVFNVYVPTEVFSACYAG